MRTIALLLGSSCLVCHSRRVLLRNLDSPKQVEPDTEVKTPASLTMLATQLLASHAHAVVPRVRSPSLAKQHLGIGVSGEPKKEESDELERAIQLLKDKFEANDGVVERTQSNELLDALDVAQSNLVRQAADTYSWSMKSLSTSQAWALDAYVWSIEAASNAAANVTDAIGSLQYPALLPTWFKALIDSGNYEDSATSAESKDDDNEGYFAAALSIVWLLEAIGPVSLAILGLFYSGLLGTNLGALEPFIYSEAYFYILCCMIAIGDRGDKSTWSSLDEPWRREFWRRILSDPSQSPRDFMEGWIYRDADYPHFSNFELLLRSLLRGVGLQTKPKVDTVATGPGGRVLLERYGVPMEEMSVGDVYAGFCRSLYGKRDRRNLTPEEDLELRQLVDEFEDAAGFKFRRELVRSQKGKHGVMDGRLSEATITTDMFSTTPGLSAIVNPTPDAPLRWRHRPLLFYAIAQGAYGGIYTSLIMQQNGFVHREEGVMSYWLRPGNRTDGESVPDALVFIHGIGFGVAPYVEAVLQMAAPEVDILMIELPGASQHVFSRNPSSREIGGLVVNALDSLGLQRCVVVGHSLGTNYASYIAHHDAKTGERRVGGVALIDPIPTTLHHSRTLREVVFTPLESCQQSLEDFLFKKELWTSIEVQKRVPFQEASFWLEECFPQTPTLIAVGSNDVINAPSATAKIFGSWQARLRGVRVLNMQGISHGEWLFNESASSQLFQAIQSLRSEAASIGVAETAVTGAAADISEVTSAVRVASSKAGAGFSDATSKASADLVSATEPVVQAALRQFAGAFQEVAVEAAMAQKLLRGCP